MADRKKARAKSKAGRKARKIAAVSIPRKAAAKRRPVVKKATRVASVVAASPVAAASVSAAPMPAAETGGEELRGTERRRRMSSEERRFWFGRQEIAKVFGVTVRTINRWVGRGDFVKSHEGLYDIREVVTWLQGRQEDEHADLDPEARWKLARAERIELSLAVEKRLLVEREAIIRSASPVVHALRSSLQGLPERLVAWVPDAERSMEREKLYQLIETHLKELQTVMAEGKYENE